MNVLFLSMAGIGDLDHQSIYGDLLKTFVAHGHEVYAVSPSERRTGLPTINNKKQYIHTLDVHTGNLTKCSLPEKALSQILLEGEFSHAISRYWSHVKFDLIIYPTPPTTLHGLIAHLKTQHSARTYLLLKDIFPQNSLDLGMLSTKGSKGLVYSYFKKSERKTYEVSDRIGCMSEANRAYLLEHEPWLGADRVEVNPNSVIPYDKPKVDVAQLREDLGFSRDAKVLVYGGNLGKPQAMDFLIRVLRLNESRNVALFVIAGSGTERGKLEAFFESQRPRNAILLPPLQREAFDCLLWAADAGIVLLDNRFTIPNFPSRILSYMQAGLPYIAATDAVSDVGDVAVAGEFGLKVDSHDEMRFLDACADVGRDEFKAMGAKANAYLKKHYTSERSYELIMESMND